MPFNKTSSSKPVIFMPFREGVKKEEEVRWWEMAVTAAEESSSIRSREACVMIRVVQTTQGRKEGVVEEEEFR